MDVWDDHFPLGPDGEELEEQLQASPEHYTTMRKGDELVHIHAYARPKMVVLNYPAYVAGGRTLPGVVLDMPVGPAMPLFERYAEAVARHKREGWKHTDPATHTR